MDDTAEPTKTTKAKKLFATDSIDGKGLRGREEAENSGPTAPSNDEDVSLTESHDKRKKSSLKDSKTDADGGRTSKRTKISKQVMT